MVEGYLEFSYKPCKYTIKQNKKNKHLNNIIIYNVPKDIKEASFSKIYKTDKKRYPTILWLTEFMDKYKIIDQDGFIYTVEERECNTG